MSVTVFDKTQHSGTSQAGAGAPRLQSLPLAELFAQLHSSEHGLTSQEARRRLAQFGPNQLTSTHRTSTLFQVLRFCASPLVIILLIASLLSAIVGELINAAIIVVMVLVSIALDFVQTHRSQRAVERLRAQVALAASVLRDGAWVTVAPRALVPGDLIRLAAGDLVPADARLIDARDLHVNQASLTGESLPVEKAPQQHAATPRDPADTSDTVFLGSAIVSGTTTALITATGPATTFGDIAARLATQAPETAFDRGTRQFGMFIMQMVIFLVLFVALVSAALHRNGLESLLFALALAVGLTPEFLPMITTVTLARGAVRMARQQVIVKNLAAIQNFGSMDILCSDKTGTLTSGEMALDQHLDPRGQPCERVFVLAYLNSAYETGVQDPTDNVDASSTRKPRRWEIALIRDFMLVIGPISSIYDFVTFFVLLRLFHASEALFHTGWFVESLATQTLVLFVIRTVGNPLRSRPSWPLALTTLLIVALAIMLPYTPLGGLLGFVPLPAAYFAFLAGASVTYLLLVEFAKRPLMRRRWAAD